MRFPENKMPAHAWCLGWVVFFISSAPLLNAQAPDWWAQRGVVDSQKIPNDYAAVNQGQLKFMAIKAYEELNAKLPGGAGTALAALNQTLVATAGGTGNYRPVNAGQLKNLAKPFYDRLIEVGYAGSYPWAGSSNANDYTLVNIGQVKNIFKFDVGKDADADTLPDWWELKTFGNLSQSGGEDKDGDDLTNLQEYQQQSDPNNYYSQGALTVVPALSLVSGDGQLGSAGEWLANPVILKVTNSQDGIVLKGAPVTFEVVQGNFTLAASRADPLVPVTGLAADAQGRITVHVKVSPASTSVGQIRAKTSTASLDFGYGMVATLPTVTITSPLHRAEIGAGEMVTVHAQISSTVGVGDVKAYDGTQLLGTMTVGEDGIFTYIWQNIPAGEHTLVVRAEAQGSSLRSSASFLHLTVRAGKSESVALDQPLGGMASELPAGQTVSHSMPVLPRAIYAGRLQSITNGFIRFQPVPGWADNELGLNYVMMPVEGPLEGRRYPLTVTDGVTNNNEGCYVAIPEVDRVQLTAGTRILLLPEWNLKLLGSQGGIQSSTEGSGRLTEFLQPVSWSESAGWELGTESFYLEGETWKSSSAAGDFGTRKIGLGSVFMIRQPEGQPAKIWYPIGDVATMRWQEAMQTDVLEVLTHWAGIPRLESQSLDESGLAEGGFFRPESGPDTLGDRLFSGTDPQFYRLIGDWRGTGASGEFSAGQEKVIQPASVVILKRRPASVSGPSHWENWPLGEERP